MEALLFLPNDFEETEAITTIDILRRGKVSLLTVSLTDDLMVTGVNGVSIMADLLLKDIISSSCKMVVLPGGSGYRDFLSNETFLDYLKEHYNAGKYLAAICAAPIVFSRLGFLKDKKCVCFDSLQSEIDCKELIVEPVVVDDNIITARAMGSVMYFGLMLVKILRGEDKANDIKSSICL